MDLPGDHEVVSDPVYCHWPHGQGVDGDSSWGWSGPVRVIGALRALTPSQSKGHSTFSQIPEAESSPTWRGGMVVKTLHSSHFSIVQAHLSFLYEKGQYYKKKKRFRSPVPSQGHHAATSHHIKKYFNSQVAPFFWIIELREYDPLEPKQRDRLHSLDMGLDYTGECLKKFIQTLSFALQNTEIFHGPGYTMLHSKLESLLVNSLTSLRWLQEIHNNLHLFGQLLCIQCLLCHVHSYHFLLRW